MRFPQAVRLRQINGCVGNRPIVHCIATQKGHAVMARRAVRPSIELIRSIPLFSDISDQACSELAAAATLRQFAARAVLFNEAASRTISTLC